jgi:hypothetical protein
LWAEREMKILYQEKKKYIIVMANLDSQLDGIERCLRD